MNFFREEIIILPLISYLTFINYRNHANVVLFCTKEVTTLLFFKYCKEMRLESEYDYVISIT